MMAARPRRHAPHRLFLGLAAALVAGVCALGVLRFGVPWPCAYLGGVNLCTLLFYGYDKLAARRGAARVPEAALHVLAAAGGSPAAWVAQQAFRHKTVKGSFRRVFWCIVILQAAAVAAWLWLR